jgi:hypothetical protein
VGVEVRAAHEPSKNLAGLGIREVELDVQVPELRHEGEAAAVRRNSGSQVHAAAASRSRDDRTGDLARFLVLSHERKVGAADRRLPFLTDLVERGVQNPLERVRIRYALTHLLEDLPDHRIAPAAADVRPERVTPAVGEEPAVPRHLLDGGDPSGQRRVAEPHRRMRRYRPDREVFGHPLDEPERCLEPPSRGLDAAARSAEAGDVVLEGVDQLVTDQVIRFLHRVHERHHDPLLERLRDALHAFADVTDDVVLLELWMVRVEDERLTLFELVVQDP